MKKSTPTLKNGSGEPHCKTMRLQNIHYLSCTVEGLASLRIRKKA